MSVKFFQAGWSIPSVSACSRICGGSQPVIESGEVPRIGTLQLWSLMARLFGICPPTETMTPSGFSRSRTSSTLSKTIRRIEPVAHIVVRRNRLGVIVYHNRLIAQIAGRLHSIDRTPVEFHRAAIRYAPEPSTTTDFPSKGYLTSW